MGGTPQVACKTALKRYRTIVTLSCFMQRGSKWNVGCRDWEDECCSRLVRDERIVGGVSGETRLHLVDCVVSQASLFC